MIEFCVDSFVMLAKPIQEHVCARISIPSYCKRIQSTEGCTWDRREAARLGSRSLGAGLQLRESRLQLLLPLQRICQLALQVGHALSLRPHHRP